MASVGVFSYERDLHAHAIADEINRRGRHSVNFFSTDSLVTHGGISWSSRRLHRARLKDYQGKWVAIEDLSVAWWRRIHQPLNFPKTITNELDRDFITHEWRGALSGSVFDAFDGIWVNHPSKDSVAANKLYQLTAACEIGFRVPDTLISQQPREIRAFCGKHGGRIVAKKLTGSTLKATVSLVVDTDQLAKDELLTPCPAMYQEIIQSTNHLRVNCFGNKVFAFLISSPEFDWRRRMDVRFIPYKLDAIVAQRVVRLTKSLGLKYGIYDMILPDNGEPVWIELNPQGQFLFCEALSGFPLASYFTDFLESLID